MNPHRRPRNTRRWPLNPRRRSRNPRRRPRNDRRWPLNLRRREKKSHTPAVAKKGPYFFVALYFSWLHIFSIQLKLSTHKKYPTAAKCWHKKLSSCRPVLSKETIQPLLSTVKVRIRMGVAMNVDLGRDAGIGSLLMRGLRRGSGLREALGWGCGGFGVKSWGRYSEVGVWAWGFGVELGAEGWSQVPALVIGLGFGPWSLAQALVRGPWPRLRFGFTLALLWLCFGFALASLWLCPGFALASLWLCPGFALALLCLCSGFALAWLWLCSGPSLSSNRHEQLIATDGGRVQFPPSGSPRCFYMNPPRPARHATPAHPALQTLAAPS